MRLEENKRVWDTEYKWPENGDEWSVGWGGTKYMWYSSIFPRIFNFLPTNHILEIAPGFGRCTQFLKDLCKKLIIVDISKKCIDFCKKRFKNNENIEYYVNDGISLDFIENNSIDFIFSWDSFVHIESDETKSYIAEFSRVLKEEGYGFIHHSNLGSFKEEDLAEDTLVRSRSMSAKLFNEFCKQYGLQIIIQEIMPWGNIQNLDCLSLFTKNSDRKINEIIINNKEFVQEKINMKRVSTYYKK